MGQYFGISRLDQAWNGVFVQNDPKAPATIQYVPERPPPRSQIGVAGASAAEASEPPFSNIELHAQLTQLTAGSSGRPWPADWLVRTERSCWQRIKMQLDRLNLSRRYSESTNYKRPDGIGIAHAYGASLPLRRVLPVIVAGRALPELRKRTICDAPQSELSSHDGIPACAIEAPLAVALELAAQSEITLPATVLLGNRGVLGTELTLLDVVLSAQQLEVRVTAFADPAEQLDSVRMVQLMNVVRRCASHRTLTFLAIGTTAANVVNLVSAQLTEQTTVRTLDESTVAAGAARYALLCGRSEETGLPFHRVNFQLLAPWPIGVVGRADHPDQDGGLCSLGSPQGGKGCVYWLPLCEPGMTLEGQSMSFPLSGDIPDQLLLAECLDANRIPRTAVAGLQSLRCYSLVNVESEVTPQESDRIEVSIQSSTGCLNYGWSDPFVRAYATS